VAVVITPAQRDALYEQLVIRLPGIEGVWFAVHQGNFETAERLAREFSDNLGLLVDDLGFGEGSGEAVELRTPPDVVRRVLERLRDRAEGRSEVEAKERNEARTLAAENALVLKTCESLLSALDAS
jgi:hypothetical protein